jgi:hypothetical protein
MNILNNLIQPWSLVIFGVAGFLFFLTIGKMSKNP